MGEVLFDYWCLVFDEACEFVELRNRVVDPCSDWHEESVGQHRLVKVFSAAIEDGPDNLPTVERVEVMGIFLHGVAVQACIQFETLEIVVTSGSKNGVEESAERSHCCLQILVSAWRCSRVMFSQL